MRFWALLVLASALCACGDDASRPLVSADAPCSRPAAPSSRAATSPARDDGCVVETSRPAKTWTVRSGDSLRKIARQVYGDENLWKAIRDANPEKTAADGKIAVGAVLTIPYDGI